MQKVKLEDAVGLKLGHDITRIVPGKLKYRAYQRGHVLVPEDIPRLMDLGKKNVYVWGQEDNMVHEDEGALRLASTAAGPGITWTEPSQGRVNLVAMYNGLIKINVEQLNRVNNMDDIIFATVHNNRTVVKDQVVAGTRVVPVAISKSNLEYAEKLCGHPLPLIKVQPFKPLWVALITTGSEINSGRISDGFSKLMRRKISPFGGRWMGQVTVPDDAGIIALEVQNFVAEGAELILVTGGMSVDADDVTPTGIKMSGAQVVFYGAPVLPGSQFMLGYQGSVAICGVPAGALFSRRTTLDLLLPRIFCGDIINRADIIALGHGGLCEECLNCHYPLCPFGKTGI